MHLRRGLALAPRPARTLVWAVLAALYLGTLGLFNRSGTWWWIFSGVVTVAVAAWVLLGGEQWNHRQLCRRLSWTGDPDTARLVRADVDAGRLPSRDPARRELARRYATDALQRQRRAPVAAVIFGLLAVAVVVLNFTDGGSLRDVAGLLGIVLFFQYQAWVRLPRYRRVLTHLRDHDNNGVTSEHATPS